MPSSCPGAPEPGSHVVIAGDMLWPEFYPEISFLRKEELKN